VGLFHDIETNESIGVTRIFFRPDGAKIDRKFLGLVEGSAAKLDQPKDGLLCVAEGVETAMAARQLGIGPAWALGSCRQSRRSRRCRKYRRRSKAVKGDATFARKAKERVKGNYVQTPPSLAGNTAWRASSHTTLRIFGIMCAVHIRWWDVTEMAGSTSRKGPSLKPVSTRMRSRPRSVAPRRQNWA
jgi:hypothetical protein